MVQMEEAKLIKSLQSYPRFLMFSTMFATLAPRLAITSSILSPVIGVMTPSVGLDALLTCFFFALATLPLQASLACLLERKPAPAPRLANWSAWLVGICSWMSISCFFLTYTTFGGSYAPACWEWMVAAVASVANLAIVVCTVRRYVAVEGTIMG